MIGGWLRVTLASWLALVATPLQGCDDDPREEPLPSLLEPGPHAIGYSRLSVTYAPEGVDGERTLGLDVWYPAQPDTGEATTYSVAGVVAVERPGVFTDATIVGGDTLPVVAYSHGNRGVGLVGFDYGEHFASWGWVVVAPDHTGNTVLDASNPSAMSSLVRPQDLSAVLDWLEEGSPAWLAGRTDDRILAVGHSFGAYTVLSMAGALSDWSARDDACAALPPDEDDSSCAIFADADSRAVLEGGFFDGRIDAVVPQAGSARYAEGALRWPA